MRNRIKILLSIIFLLPIMVFADDKIVQNVNPKENIYIASSELIEITPGVEEVSQPTIKDWNIKFNIKFSKVNQSIKYKLIVKNTSKKDYNVTIEPTFNKSNYITYNYKYSDKSNILEANTEKEMIITITYSKEVPTNKLHDGKFKENNLMYLSVNDNLINPKTIIQKYSINIMLLIITGLIAFYLLKTKNIKNSLKIFMFGLLLIPIATKAFDIIRLTIDSNVEIDTISDKLLYRKLISNEASNKTYKTGISEITTKGNPNFDDYWTNDKGMYAMADDYGTSYYYRGDVKNNWVSFAGFLWQVIRVNGDNSVRLIYSDNEISIYSPFNSNNDSPKYIGYMFGDTDATEDEAFINKNDSTIKKAIDNWYVANLSKYSSYISDEVFCNDRTLASGEVFSTSPQDSMKFATYARNNYSDNQKPQLTCPNISRDGFTTKNASIGNKALTYPIGLITADEANLANVRNYYCSGDYNQTCGSSYLSNSIGATFTMSPFSYTTTWYGSSEINMFGILTGGSDETDLDWMWGDTGADNPEKSNIRTSIRPSINLKNTIQTTDGSGTKEDPYIILAND